MTNAADGKKIECGQRLRRTFDGVEIVAAWVDPDGTVTDTDGDEWNAWELEHVAPTNAERREALGDGIMHMTKEPWNIQAREEIQELRKHITDALTAISRPECDFDTALLAMSKAWFNGDKCMDLIYEGRQLHGDE